MHAIRQISRIRLLSTAHRSRNDVEGIEEVDIEAQSHNEWKAFVDSLNHTEQLALRILRGGAAKHTNEDARS